MGLVLRVFQSRKRALMLKLLISLIIPLLEYCCQLWNPWKAKDIQARGIGNISSKLTLNVNKTQMIMLSPKKRI